MASSKEMKLGRGIAAICLLMSAGLMALGAGRRFADGPAGVDSATSLAATADDKLFAAICPVVYQLDESSTHRGYHYIFYGNAFFINEEGYLITAAHVLTDFRDGGQPYLLLRWPEAPPRLVKAEVVAMDPVHDVAVLRAIPNPFTGRCQVAYLRLSADKPPLGAMVIAAALRPSRLKDPHTFDAPQEDYSSAEVTQYTTSSLGKGQAATDLLLFSHEVIRGQSGAPVVGENEKQVVGIVEGRWLRDSLPGPPAWAKGNPTMGAAIPIAYAIPLLQENHVSWRPSTASPKSN